jgi:diadenosine tetraphosphate (Ap4A) HIT family hydrolase
MTYDKNNTFARILRKEIPARIVYEDDYALAFHDVNPKAPVHVLVIPKGEYMAFLDFSEKAPPEVIQGFMKAVQHVVQLLKLEEEGFRLLANQGGHAGQEVPHFHIHIFGGRFLGPMITAA